MSKLPIYGLYHQRQAASAGDGLCVAVGVGNSVGANVGVAPGVSVDSDVDVGVLFSAILLGVWWNGTQVVNIVHSSSGRSRDISLGFLASSSSRYSTAQSSLVVNESASAVGLPSRSVGDAE